MRAGASLQRMRAARSIDEPGAGGDGVGEVLVCGIERPDGGGDAALRPARVAVVDAALGEHEYGAEAPCFERHEQAGDAAPEDDHCDTRGRPGFGRRRCAKPGRS